MTLIGVGLYTFKETALLTGIPTRDLRRWLRGYHHKNARTAEGVFSPPLWDTQLKDTEMDGIGFHDLLEVRFVHAFRAHGVSLMTIRAAARHARGIFDQDYPFTCRRFLTDGKSIFAEAVREAGEEALVDLPERQLVFRNIIHPSLYAGIDFDDDGSALRWYPLANSRAVVLDPGIAFGKPVLADYGIPTASVHEAVVAEESVARTARLFEIPVNAVEAAVRFETRNAA